MNPQNKLLQTNHFNVFKDLFTTSSGYILSKETINHYFDLQQTRQFTITLKKVLQFVIVKKLKVFCQFFFFQDLVVDDSNDGQTNGNGNRSPRENGIDGLKKDPLSPSSARSTPASSSGKKDSDKSRSSPGAKVSPKPLGALGKQFVLQTKPVF